MTPRPSAEPSSTQASSPRIGGLDVLRGVLVVSVVVGHAVPGKLAEVEVRQLIYLIHMPAFLALSGYVLSPGRLAQMGFAGTVRRYWVRAVVPWLAAWAVWVLVLDEAGVFAGDGVARRLLVLSIFTYHLWYVPVWLMCIALLLMCEMVDARARRSIAVWLLVAVSLVVGVWGRWNRVVLPMGIDERVVLYPVFFFAGVTAKRLSQRVETTPIVPLTIGAVSATSALYWMEFVYEFETRQVSDAAILGLRILAVGLIVASVGEWRVQPPRLLSKVSNQSLAIYLWHPMILLVTTGLLSTSNWTVWTMIGVTLTMAMAVGSEWWAKSRYAVTDMVGLARPTS